MSMPACPSWPAGSGTPARGPPTGTSQQIPGCWPWPPGEWPASAPSIRPPGPRSRDGQPRPDLAAVLHRPDRSEEHTSELQSRRDLVCRLLLEKKKNKISRFLIKEKKKKKKKK